VCPKYLNDATRLRRPEKANRTDNFAEHANPLFSRALYPNRMESLSYSRTALAKATILAIFVAPFALAFVAEPSAVEGRGSGVIGVYLRATGPIGHIALSALLCLALATLAFRSLRLLLGSRVAARFGPDGVELDNGWRKRKAAWKDVLGAAVETRRVRIRGSERVFELLVVTLCRASGSADRVKIMLSELNADWARAERWCQGLGEARQHALRETPAMPTPAPHATHLAPARETFGRRVIERS